MRLVDADALYAKLDDMTVFGETFITAVEFAKLVIQDAPTIGGWISVKDRLPETGTLALVFGSAGAMTVARYIAVNQWLVPGIFSAITHWMPLPTPPEVNRDDD